MKKLSILAAALAMVVMASANVMAGETTLGVAIRSLANPYQANYKVGGEIIAKKTGLPLVVLTCEGSSEKQVNDIKSLVAATQGNVVFMIDPNEAPDMLPIAIALEESGVYFSTWWNKPEGVNATDFDHWVSHMAYDGVAAGKTAAKELFKTFKTPNKGKVIAIQGMLANYSNQSRFDGLKEAIAENPGIELVGTEAADWDRTKAYEKMKNLLIANPDVDGVWCANDNMALGAVEALRERGLAGKVLVTGCDGVDEVFAAIKSGEIAATVFQDSKFQAGISLAHALAAKNGTLKVSDIPEERRQFFVEPVYVTRENINEFEEKYIKNTPEYNFDDLYGSFYRTMEKD